MNSKDLAKYIDHTNLKPFATEHDINSLCQEAVTYEFAAVCINPVWVPFANIALKNSPVNLCSVVGFPLGATTTDIKLAETEFCLDNGADEIDMVINLGEAKLGNWTYVENEVRALSNLCHDKGAILKVIFETCYLDQSEIISACESSMKGGADYVKTSTGFGNGGATIDDVKIMITAVDGECKVKASGGIRDKEAALAMIEAGADRIGTSSGIAIVS